MSESEERALGVGARGEIGSAEPFTAAQEDAWTYGGEIVVEQGSEVEPPAVTEPEEPRVELAHEEGSVIEEDEK